MVTRITINTEEAKQAAIDAASAVLSSVTGGTTVAPQQQPMVDPATKRDATYLHLRGIKDYSPLASMPEDALIIQGRARVEPDGRRGFIAFDRKANKQVFIADDEMRGNFTDKDGNGIPDYLEQH